MFRNGACYCVKEGFVRNFEYKPVFYGVLFNQQLSILAEIEYIRFNIGAEFYITLWNVILTALKYLIKRLLWTWCTFNEWLMISTRSWDAESSAFRSHPCKSGSVSVHAPGAPGKGLLSHTRTLGLKDQPVEGLHRASLQPCVVKSICSNSPYRRKFKMKFSTLVFCRNALKINDQAAFWGSCCTEGAASDILIGGLLINVFICFQVIFILIDFYYGNPSKQLTSSIGHWLGRLSGMEPEDTLTCWLVCLAF